MEVFPKIAKLFLYMLFGFAVFFFVFDLGKSYIASTENTYIAANASNYVSKFIIQEEDLLVFDKETMELDVVKQSLDEYFDMQYLNLGYDRADGKDMSGGNRGDHQYKAIYYPKGWGDDDHMWLGPVIVRAKLYGFPGLPVVEESKKGMIVVNVEHKVPSSMRNYMKLQKIEIDAGEGQAGGKDFDGFWGYYSIISQYSFKVNIVQ